MIWIAFRRQTGRHGVPCLAVAGVGLPRHIGLAVVAAWAAF